MARFWQKAEARLRRLQVFNEGFSFAAAMGKRSLPTNAAGISFYFFISVIPFFTLLCSQLPYTGISSEGLIEAVTRLTPDSVDSLAESVINQAYSSRIALFSVSLVILMWSSAKVVTAVIRSLDAVYGQTDNRNYFVVTGNALIYTALLLLGSGLALLAFTRGKTAEEFLLSLLPNSVLSRSVPVILRRVLGVVLFVLFFSLVYKVFPSGKRSFLCQVPGALVAQTGILVFTSFYGVYQTRRNVYTSFYGSLANLAVSMVWVYTCVILFLLGAVFNVHYESRIRAFFHKNQNGGAQQ